MNYAFNDPASKHLRRHVRKNATESEQLLWEHLRNRRLLGLKFRRGSQIGRYYVDFYCPEKKLVIEVDGSIHRLPDQAEYDSMRETDLQAMGMKIVRFSNKQILHEMPKVVFEIEQSL